MYLKGGEQALERVKYGLAYSVERGWGGGRAPLYRQ